MSSSDDDGGSFVAMYGTPPKGGVGRLKQGFNVVSQTTEEIVNALKARRDVLKRGLSNVRAMEAELKAIESMLAAYEPPAEGP